MTQSWRTPDVRRGGWEPLDVTEANSIIFVYEEQVKPEVYLSTKLGCLSYVTHFILVKEVNPQSKLQAKRFYKHTCAQLQTLPTLLAQN